MPRLLVLGFTECFKLKMCRVLGYIESTSERCPSLTVLPTEIKANSDFSQLTLSYFLDFHRRNHLHSLVTHCIPFGQTWQLSRWPIFFRSIRLNEQKHAMNASFAVFNVRRADLTSITVASSINSHSCIWKHKFCISAQTQKRGINHRPCYLCTAQRECNCPPDPPTSPHPAFFSLSCIPNRSTVFHPHYGHTMSLRVCSCHQAGGMIRQGDELLTAAR